MDELCYMIAEHDMMRAVGEADRVEVQDRPLYRNTIFYQYLVLVYLYHNIMCAREGVGRVAGHDLRGRPLH